MTAATLLYVEDNDDLRLTIGMILEGADREVTCCASGEEALALLAERDFDILVTDVSLPGISGTELVRQVLARRPAQWVVLCSGYEFKHGLAGLGENVRSLPKPFEIEDMDALLDEIVAALAAT